MGARELSSQNLIEKFIVSVSLAMDKASIGVVQQESEAVVKLLKQTYDFKKQNASIGAAEAKSAAIQKKLSQTSDLHQQKLALAKKKTESQVLKIQMFQNKEKLKQLKIANDIAIKSARFVESQKRAKEHIKDSRKNMEKMAQMMETAGSGFAATWANKAVSGSAQVSADYKTDQIAVGAKLGAEGLAKVEAAMKRIEKQSGGMFGKEEMMSVAQTYTEIDANADRLIKTMDYGRIKSLAVKKSMKEIATLRANFIQGNASFGSLQGLVPTQKIKQLELTYGSLTDTLKYSVKKRGEIFDANVRLSEGDKRAAAENSKSINSALIRLSGMWTKFQNQIGNTLSPMLIGFVNLLSRLSAFLNKHSGAQSIAAWAVLGTVAVTSLVAGIAVLITVMTTLKIRTGLLWIWSQLLKLSMLREKIAVIARTVAYVAATIAMFIFNGVMALGTVVMTAFAVASNLAGLPITALAALVFVLIGVLWLLWAAFGDDIKAGLSKFWTALVGWVKEAWDWLGKLYEKIKHFIGVLVDNVFDFKWLMKLSGFLGDLMHQWTELSESTAKWFDQLLDFQVPSWLKDFGDLFTGGVMSGNIGVSGPLIPAPGGSGVSVNSSRKIQVDGVHIQISQGANADEMRKVVVGVVNEKFRDASRHLEE